MMVPLRIYSLIITQSEVAALFTISHATVVLATLGFFVTFTLCVCRVIDYERSTVLALGPLWNRIQYLIGIANQTVQFSTRPGPPDRPPAALQATTTDTNETILAH